ncbi:hypothetical protein [Nocardia uniformis]|uniref:hypothetical protein n=1 Tax=Nocardia uniformis TaxID=53432 RepID=UPI001FDF6DB8|nr:hypothetical protein [Nocardia uniformis]
MPQRIRQRFLDPAHLGAAVVGGVAFDLHRESAIQGEDGQLGRHPRTHDADEHAMAIAVAAVKAIPYGLVREYIAAAAPIPDWVDDITATAAAAVVHELRPARTGG